MSRVSTLVLVLVGALTFAGCSADDAAPTDARRQLAQLDAHLSLGESVAVGNLTVWPVFSDQPLDIGEFLTLHEAIRNKVAEVREVAGAAGQNDAGQTDAGAFFGDADEDERQSEQVLVETVDDSPFDGPATNAAIGLNGGGGGAVVNTLVIENKSNLPILICAGTVVTGGNQDRQIGQDIVVKAGTTVPVDAFCVEEGRWSNERLGDETEGLFVGASTNATIGIRSKGQYAVAQNEVWLEVAKVKRSVIEKMNASAFTEPTKIAQVAENSSLAIALDANDELTGERIETVCKSIRAHFASFGTTNAPVGFAYAINGKPVNVRSFANAKVFERQIDPFLRSMATESLLAPTTEHEEAKASDVVALVREIETAKEERRETAALNWNGVRRHVNGFAANCYVPSEGAPGGKPLLITQDWTAKQ